MRYCSECEKIVKEPDIETCPACGMVLLKLDEVLGSELDKLVVLKWCKDIEEALVLKAVLQGYGIDAMVEDETLISWVAPSDGRGGATDTRVLVRLEDAERALEIVRQKEAGELAIGEDAEVPEGVDEDTADDAG